MNCPLCGSLHSRQDTDGLWCRSCGVKLDGPYEPYGDDDRLDRMDVGNDLIDELVLEQHEWR